METESLISLAEASKLYKVSKRTIERLIRRGDLPYHRIGRQIRLSPSDLRRATSATSAAAGIRQ
jgi:putative molybdopterin biosynthesis protein